MATAPAVEEVTNWSFIAVDRIVPGENSRKMDKASPAFKELVKSIKQVGVLQPLVVRPHPEQEGTYILEAGEQRWRAAQEAGLTEVPCTIRRDDEQTAAVVTVTENMHRVDLTPLEEVDAVARLIEKGLPYKDAAAWLGKSLKSVARRASLRSLNEGVAREGRGLARRGAGAHRAPAWRCPGPRVVAARQGVHDIKGGFRSRYLPRIVRSGPSRGSSGRR